MKQILDVMIDCNIANNDYDIIDENFSTKWCTSKLNKVKNFFDVGKLKIDRYKLFVIIKILTNEKKEDNSNFLLKTNLLF